MLTVTAPGLAELLCKNEQLKLHWCCAALLPYLLNCFAGVRATRGSGWHRAVQQEVAWGP